MKKIIYFLIVFVKSEFYIGSGYSFHEKIPENFLLKDVAIGLCTSNINSLEVCEFFQSIFSILCDNNFSMSLYLLEGHIKDIKFGINVIFYFAWGEKFLIALNIQSMGLYVAYQNLRCKILIATNKSNYFCFSFSFEYLFKRKPLYFNCFLNIPIFNKNLKKILQEIKQYSRKDEKSAAQYDADKKLCECLKYFKDVNNNQLNKNNQDDIEKYKQQEQNYIHDYFSKNMSIDDIKGVSGNEFKYFHSLDHYKKVMEILSIEQSIFLMDVFDIKIDNSFIIDTSVLIQHIHNVINITHKIDDEFELLDSYNKLLEIINWIKNFKNAKIDKYNFYQSCLKKFSQKMQELSEILNGLDEKFDALKNKVLLAAQKEITNLDNKKVPELGVESNSQDLNKNIEELIKKTKADEEAAQKAATKEAVNELAAHMGKYEKMIITIVMAKQSKKNIKDMLLSNTPKTGKIDKQILEKLQNLNIYFLEIKLVENYDFGWIETLFFGF